jgi:hypothetical protein
MVVDLFQRVRSYKMITYEEVVIDEKYTMIKATSDDSLILWIPIDPANSDYQAYLKSLDEAPTL